MNFYKLHLMVEDHNMHPLQKWKNDNFTSAGLRRDLDPDLEVPYPGEYEVVHVASLEGDTFGVRAFGAQNDIPAEDPYKVANWYFFIGQQENNLLLGLPAYIRNGSGGSFHERWVRLRFYVLVPDDPKYHSLKTQSTIDQNLDTWGGTGLKFFRYQGLRSLVDMVEKDHPQVPHPVKHGEDREQYWQRLIGQYKKPTQYGDYDSSDRYWQKNKSLGS